MLFTQHFRSLSARNSYLRSHIVPKICLLMRVVWTLEHSPCYYLTVGHKTTLFRRCRAPASPRHLNQLSFISKLGCCSCKVPSLRSACQPTNPRHDRVRFIEKPLSCVFRSAILRRMQCTGFISLPHSIHNNLSGFTVLLVSLTAKELQKKRLGLLGVCVTLLRN